MNLSQVQEAIEAYGAGKPVIIVDDEDRENEGDLAIAAQYATPAWVNFMTVHARGLICVAMAPALIDALKIPMMVPPNRNRSGFGTGFTVSVEARHGVSTGISAPDRARTIAVLVDPASRPEDLVMPGHVFPLRAQPGGVLARRGQTEASVDLATLAGLKPVSVICEVMSADGSMARRPELQKFAHAHDIRLVSVEALVRYRKSQAAPETRQPAHMPPTPDAGIVRAAVSVMPTDYGNFRAIAYRDLLNNREHLVLCLGNLGGTPPLVRLHSACLTGDLFHSRRCDCGAQLQLALHRIARAGRGAVVYLQQEGRGIGLTNKIRAYALQDQGCDTVDANLKLGLPADARTYRSASAILKDLGVHALRLMTNNPHKLDALEMHGLKVTERVPHEVRPHADNLAYLRTKARRMNHMLSQVE